ncbi:MAG: TonB-dependent receptor plug domain-containing protein, partial [Bacteroidales bacterium]|nr:TonB-dependent receptor plug domain-containing protein [Bacteroidales bacterium]
MAQEADTLTASRVRSVRSIPVTLAAEEALMDQRLPLLSDAVRRFTGVQLKDYGGVGGLKTVNVRSLGSEHVGVFIDGIQVDNAQNMQVD